MEGGGHPLARPQHLITDYWVVCGFPPVCVFSIHKIRSGNICILIATFVLACVCSLLVPDPLFILKKDLVTTQERQSS